MPDLKETTTIRAELEQYIRREGITISKFGENTGINAGTISAIINGNRPIAMLLLDRIAAGMGLEEGSLYELYIEEFIRNSAPNWRRVRPFLYRCAELNKLDCIEQVVEFMMDYLIYAPALFETAEELFREGKFAAAAIIYKNVSESEKYQHSERLALCQYRLFTIAVGDDQDENLWAATHFESFVDRLGEVDQLDGLKDLANTYVSLRRWDKVDVLADKMCRRAKVQYEQKYGKTRKAERGKETKGPLFMYIVYSYVLRAGICDERGDYEKALEYVSLYADLSWVQEDTEEARRLKAQCSNWAEANGYLYQLMSGKLDVIPQYVAYLERNEGEILMGLFKIMLAANRYEFNVDDVLQRFEKQIAAFADHHTKVGTYTEQVSADLYARFLAELACYDLDNKRYAKGMKFLLESLSYSVVLNGNPVTIKCVGLFEKFRHTASPEETEEYKNLLREVDHFNDKKDRFFSARV
nr:transcriptional regulator [Paenibacillus terrae]